MKTSLFRAACVLLLCALPALAQTPQGGNTPTDVKSFGDWGVQCVPGALPSCEMHQATRNKAGQRIASLAFAYLPRQDRYILQLTTPLGVVLAKGVRIAASDYNSQALPFLRCDRSGCYVQGTIEKGALDALGRSAAQAKLTVTGQDGRDVQLSFSLRGFSDALAAMESLARQKLAAAGPVAAKKPAAPHR